MIWWWVLAFLFILVLAAWDIGGDILSSFEPGCQGPGPHGGALYVIPVRASVAVWCAQCRDRRQAVLQRTFIPSLSSYSSSEGGSTHEHEPRHDHVII